MFIKLRESGRQSLKSNSSVCICGAMGFCFGDNGFSFILTVNSYEQLIILQWKTRCHLSMQHAGKPPEPSNCTLCIEKGFNLFTIPSVAPTRYFDCSTHV